MKKLLLCGAALLALAACGEKTATGGDTSSAQAQVAATPELGEWGIETADMDETIAPGDDFYRHVNGAWLNAFDIPEEFSSYGSFTILFERSEERVRGIIEDAATGENAAGSVEQKIGDFFASFTDTDAIEAAGLDPLADDLAFIDGLQTHEDVARAMAEPALGLSSFFSGWVNIDSKQTSRYIFYMTQAGLGMPNRNYYLEEQFADKRPVYQAYIEQLLALSGSANAEADADAIMALETRMAEAHWEPAKRRNRDLTYNLKTADELAAFAPGAPWRVMLSSAGLGDQQEFVLREDDAIQRLAAIFGETPVETWRAYLRYHLLSDNAAILPAAYDEATFAFFGAELRGTPKQRERWKRGVAAVNSALGEAVGEVYVERYFPAQSKEKMEALVVNLRTALDERLDTLPWMGEATKAEAHAKLEKFTPKIGYPEKWRDYSDFEVVRGDAYGNAKRSRAFLWSDQIDKLGAPIDRTEWFMTPQRVNAYYNPTMNEIVFPAAILQAPFFDPNADPAVNYGAIGAVIGHEIGHGFDDQGRKSDGDGMLRDWWTEEDAANFQKLADRLGAQYAAYEPIPGFPLNPALSMGENIGDLGGLSMAYHAYKLSLNGEEAPIIDGFTGDQRFFMAWAQIWKRQVREEALKNQIATGPHSPARYRVNGVVRNIDAWYDAFGVTEDNALYLPPEERVQIW